MICYAWTTPWPHAVPDVKAFLDGVSTTTDQKAVTCPACIHALGHQKYPPPGPEGEA